jgi:methylthioribose-1-phosphate isomerase
MRFSPLFWPVRLKGNTIYILDETRLPGKLAYLKVRDYLQACRAIKEMKTRAVGQVLLVMYVFLLEAKNKRAVRHLEKVARAINASRPTLSFKILTDMVLGWVRRGGPLEKAISAFLEKLKQARIQQAKEAAQLLKDGDVVLTHCNISGALPLIGAFARQEKKNISFFVTETRPYLQGSRLTAWELRRQGFGVTLITDNMAAYTLSLGKVSKVIVGADHLALNGDIANKVGTYQIAVLARHFKIPFYVLCPPPSKAKTGQEIKIEVRPDKEMWEYLQEGVVPKGVKGYYPAFDLTPHKLITRHIYLPLPGEA